MTEDVKQENQTEIANEGTDNSDDARIKNAVQARVNQLNEKHQEKLNELRQQNEELQNQLKVFVQSHQQANPQQYQQQPGNQPDQNQQQMPEFQQQPQYDPYAILNNQKLERFHNQLGKAAEQDNEFAGLLNGSGYVVPGHIAQEIALSDMDNKMQLTKHLLQNEDDNMRVISAPAEARTALLMNIARKLSKNSDTHEDTYEPAPDITKSGNSEGLDTVNDDDIDDMVSKMRI